MGRILVCHQVQTLGVWEADRIDVRGDLAHAKLCFVLPKRVPLIRHGVEVAQVVRDHNDALLVAMPSASDEHASRQRCLGCNQRVKGNAELVDTRKLACFH